MSPFVAYPDPRLRAAAACRDGVDARLRETGERLLEAARAAEAYGLAAAHIGAIEPVVVLSTEPPAAYQLLYNPRIVAVAEELASGEEGSVSLPGIRVEILRPIWAEISCMDADGRPETRRLEGLAARVALHEIEQMQGIFFLERVSRLKRERALKRAKKLAG